MFVIVAFGIMQGRNKEAVATMYETILPKSHPGSNRGDVKGVPLIVDGEQISYFESSVNKSKIQMAKYRLRDPSTKSVLNYYQGSLSKYGTPKVKEFGDNRGGAVTVTDHNGNMRTVIALHSKKRNQTELISIGMDNYKSLAKQIEDYKKTGSTTIQMSSDGMEATTYLNKNSSTLSQMSFVTSKMSASGWKQDTKMNQIINKNLNSSKSDGFVDTRLSVVKKNGKSSIIGSYKSTETGEIITTVIKGIE